MTNPAHHPAQDPARRPSPGLLGSAAHPPQDEFWFDPEQSEHGQPPQQRRPEDPWSTDRDPLTGQPLRSLGDREARADGRGEASTTGSTAPATLDGYPVHRTEQMPRYGRAAVEPPSSGGEQFPAGTRTTPGTGERVRTFPSGPAQRTGHPGGTPGGAPSESRGIPSDSDRAAASRSAPPYVPGRDGPATAAQPVMPAPAPDGEPGVPASLASMLSTDGERVFQPTEVMDTGDLGRQPGGGGGRRSTPGANDATMAVPVVRRKPPWMSRFAALVVVTSATLVAAVPALVVLSHGLFGEKGVSPPAALGGVLMLLGLPILGAGLYPLLSGAVRAPAEGFSPDQPQAGPGAGVAARSSPGWHVLSLPPTAYLVVGIALLLASAVAVG